MLRLAVGAVVFAVALGGCSGEDGGATVDMAAGQQFSPDRIDVDAGQTVVFENVSDESHTVTAYSDDLPEGANYFASGDLEDEETARDSLADGLLEPGESFEVTLSEPGTYRYFCIPHEFSGMKGTIVVSP